MNAISVVTISDVISHLFYDNDTKFDLNTE